MSRSLAAEGYRVEEARNGLEALDKLRLLRPAAFGILGMCFWLYQWCRSDGPLQSEAIGRTLADLAADGYRTRG